MFKRVILEDWHQILPLIGFGIIFVIFIFLSIRAILMKKKDVERLAKLPLEDEADVPEEKSEINSHG